MALDEFSLVFGPLQSNKMTRFVLFTYILVSFSWLGLVSGRSLSHDMSTSAAPKDVNERSEDKGFGFLPLMFRDLRNDGILGRGSKTLIIAGEDEKAAIYKAMSGEKEAEGMKVLSNSDIEKQNSLSGEAFDVIFVNGGRMGDFVDRSLRSGGVVAERVTDESANSFQKPDGLKIVVYLRKFCSSSVIIAMKKGPAESLLPDKQSPAHSRLTEEARRAALKKLEDVLLEPPRASSGKSRSYHKRTKYLPDLLGDSLESYPRRVFIEVGLPDKEGGSGSSWFDQNYPTRNLKFDKYKIETVAAEGKEVVQPGMSDWLRRNVKEEEYVVMKAEAEAVEEMVKSKAIRLIDELFMECRPRGLSNSNQNRRAYWECLALYGKLRDEGVAVHQWWG